MIMYILISVNRFIMCSCILLASKEINWTYLTLNLSYYDIGRSSTIQTGIDGRSIGKNGMKTHNSVNSNYSTYVLYIPVPIKC